MWGREQNLVVDPTTFNEIDDPPGGVHDGQMIDRMLLHYFERFAAGLVLVEHDRRPFCNGSKRLVEGRALEQQPAQVAVGDGPLELVAVADQEEDPEAAAVEHIERVA